MVSTRSRTGSPVKQIRLTTNITSTQPMLRDTDPVKVFILPKNLSSDARILSLSHPREGTKKKFFFCPINGLFDLTQISVPSIDPRSILFSPVCNSAGDRGSESSDLLPTKVKISDGYINKDSVYYVATPFDITFLLIPFLYQRSKASAKALFQPLDDLVEDMLANDTHFRHIIHHGHGFVDSAIRTICDSVEAGDENMYRLNADKVLSALVGKAKNCAKHGLPSSLEERFVTRALETPILSIRREESTISAVEEVVSMPSFDSIVDNSDSQSSEGSTTVSAGFSEISTISSVSTPLPPDISKLEIRRLLGIRVAFRFITASYLPPELCADMQARLSTSPELDFSSLDAYLKDLEILRAETLNSRSIADFSRKRDNPGDDEMAEIRAEKKRKQDEEDKRKKAGESRGVRDLKKVNVSGMKKMSDFFSKKSIPAKTKT